MAATSMSMLALGVTSINTQYPMKITRKNNLCLSISGKDFCRTPFVRVRGRKQFSHVRLVQASMPPAPNSEKIGKDGFKNNPSSEMEKGKKGLNSIERQLKAQGERSRAAGNQLNGDDGRGEVMSYQDWYEEKEEARPRLFTTLKEWMLVVIEIIYCVVESFLLSLIGL